MDRDKRRLWLDRKHPRIEVGIDCSVGRPNGDFSAGRIIDLSEGGLKLSYAQHAIKAFLPKNRRVPGSVKDVVVEIHFELRLPDRTIQPIKCNARIIHFERLAQDVYHFGVQFTQMDDDVKTALQTYLASAMEK